MVDRREWGNSKIRTIKAEYLLLIGHRFLLAFSSCQVGKRIICELESLWQLAAGFTERRALTNRGAEANKGGVSDGKASDASRGDGSSRPMETTNDHYLAHTMHMYKSVRAVDTI
jgi:hypothetical protein